MLNWDRYLNQNEVFNRNHLCINNQEKSNQVYIYRNVLFIVIILRSCCKFTIHVHYGFWPLQIIYIIIYSIDHFFILGHAPILCSWRQFETVVSKVVSWNHLNSHKYKNKSNIMLHKFLVHITKIPSWVFKWDKLFSLRFEIYEIYMMWLNNLEMI